MTYNGNLPIVPVDMPTVVLPKADFDAFQQRYDQLLQNETRWRQALESGIFSAMVAGTTGADDGEWIDSYVMPRVRKWSAEIIRDKGLRTPGQKDCGACQGTGNTMHLDEVPCKFCKGHGVVESDGGPIYCERKR